MKAMAAAVFVLVASGLGGCEAQPDEAVSTWQGAAPALGTLRRAAPLSSRIELVTAFRAGLTGVTQRPYVLMRANSENPGETIEMIFGGLGNGIDVPAGFSKAPQNLDFKWAPEEQEGGQCPLLGRGFVWCNVIAEEARAGEKRPPIRPNSVIPWRLILGKRISGGAIGTKLVFIVGLKDGSTADLRERLYRLDQEGGKDVCVDMLDDKETCFGGYKFAELNGDGIAIVITGAGADATNKSFLDDVDVFVAEVKAANPLPPNP